MSEGEKCYKSAERNATAADFFLQHFKARRHSLCVTCHRIQHFTFYYEEKSIDNFSFFLHAQFNQLQAPSHTLLPFSLHCKRRVVGNDISLITNYNVNYINGRFDNLRKSLN
jgi:hypothetical protein